MTNFATGTGYWLDYNSGTPRFSIGTGAAGTLTKGISWNGSTFTVAGDVIGTVNINANAVTSIVYIPGTEITVPMPTQIVDYESSVTIFNGATAASSLPIVSVATKRIILLSLTMYHTDTSPGDIRIICNGKIQSLDAPTRMSGGNNTNTYTYMFCEETAANSAVLPNITFTLKQATTFWTTGSVVKVTPNITIFTGKR
jgi:hypothetical protein